MSRDVPEWIGSTDDQAIPARVKVRVFDRFDGKCCACTLLVQGKLRPAYDHIQALINGGEHREHNLQLLCVPCHALKTRADVAEKSVTARKRTKHLGIKKPRTILGGKNFRGEPIRYERNR
jgi:5-methylcytosine-specific restriction endonuclease McrA